MDLFNRRHEVILVAPTSATDDNIGGNTYHTSLPYQSIAHEQRRPRDLVPRRLWARKAVMFVDEFKQVIILDEQMRQSEYAPFRHLLHELGRALTGSNFSLNSKAITSLVALHWKALQRWLNGTPFGTW
ncbi:uncharacterized protein ATNIH1004_001531 [Aspergillus tanneri]|uniref:Uncharacterized protein n=1 Tax=Aspergillus tanneri TaxID=1220188 RepID=A0A5M9N2S9_9EURO|nr:uncharacterized protein ATNIH1004_001531 [Aspergillus tanneri]KAA8652626.1 hypothetical protein ATNIH1004_001531 [Aspergillus tanneri]